MSQSVPSTYVKLGQNQISGISTIWMVRSVSEALGWYVLPSIICAVKNLAIEVPCQVYRSIDFALANESQLSRTGFRCNAYH